MGYEDRQEELRKARIKTAKTMAVIILIGCVLISIGCAAMHPAFGIFVLGFLIVAVTIGGWVFYEDNLRR